MDKTRLISGIFMVILLVVIKALVTHSKASIENMNETLVRKKAEEDKDKDSVLLASLIDKPESYIFAIDLIITTISVLCGFIYYAFIYESLNHICTDYHLTNPFAIGLVQVSMVIFLVLIVALFGSLLPKKLALLEPERTAYRTISFMMSLMVILRPLTYLLQILIHFFIRLLGINPEELNDNVTGEEIISMVTEGHELGIFEASEVEMISNIIGFDKKEVRDVMTQRKSIVGIDAKLSIQEAMEFMVEENYSRYPLYEGNIDNIVGILHMKDIIKYVLYKKEQDTELKNLARKPCFVPETQNIDILLDNMQNNKVHMAVVVDEYGQTAGIVALEDVIEEIVGNILDEYDEEERTIIKQSNGHFIMRGLAALEEVEDALKIVINKEEHATLNGLLISILQRIPNDGEKINIVYDGYLFEVLDVKNNMIKFVRVKKNVISKKIEPLEEPSNKEGISAK